VKNEWGGKKKDNQGKGKNRISERKGEMQRVQTLFSVDRLPEEDKKEGDWGAEKAHPSGGWGG